MEKIVYEISDNVFLSFKKPKEKLKILSMGTEEIDRISVKRDRPAKANTKNSTKNKNKRK